jgi:hypothetical protein
MIAAVLGDVKMPPPRPSGKARNSKTQLSNVERHLLDGFTPEAAAVIYAPPLGSKCWLTQLDGR